MIPICMIFKKAMRFNYCNFKAEMSKKIPVSNSLPKN